VADPQAPFNTTGGRHMKMKMVLAEKLYRKHPPYYAVSFDATVRDTAKAMADENIGAILIEMPVHEEGVFAGIVSERDIIKCCAHYSNFETLPVSEIMQQNMVTADVCDDVDKTIILMRNSHIRHIPLVDDGKIVALISIRDLMYCIDMEKEITMRHMSDLLGCTHKNINY
jgi:signal-transduction protein with cAMP-binding, CBS, and nucleotidyltransferase domain